MGRAAPWSAVAVIVAAVCAGLAAALLVRGPSVARGRVAGSAPARPSRLVLIPGVAGVTVLAGVLDPSHAVLAAILGVSGLVAVAMLRARSRGQAATRTAREVLEACEGIAAELVAGQPPGVALERGATEWSFLAPVAEAFRVGADVPAAWRTAADRPGAGDLRLVAAAWHVAGRTGAGLAATLEHVVADLRAARATQRVVDGELASARATARLVALLPVLALAMGSGAGGDPWGFLLGQPIGLACLGLGLAFGLAGLAWIEALARDVSRA